MKAIFVDGASLWNLSKGLGIKTIFYPILHEILVTRVGIPTLAHRAIMTVKPSVGLEKTARLSGFEPIPVESLGGDDDRALIAEIVKADPATVSEIVMIGADGDFTPVLRRKVEEGIKVHWVSARILGRDGHPMIGQVLEYLFQTKTFEFFDLTPFAKSMEYDPPASSHGYRLILETPSAGEYPHIVSRIAEALGDEFPDLRLIPEDNWDKSRK